MSLRRIIGERKILIQTQRRPLLVAIATMFPGKELVAVPVYAYMAVLISKGSCRPKCSQKTLSSHQVTL